MTVSFVGTESWVASFVNDRPATQQAELLKHEQGHYMLSALFARDFHNELKTMAAKDWATSTAGQAEMNRINKVYTEDECQKLHKAYDKKVPNPVANPAEQTKWDTAIETSRTSNKPIKDCLKAAALI